MPATTIDEVRRRLGGNPSGGGDVPLPDSVARRIGEAIAGVVADAIRRRLAGTPDPDEGGWESEVVAALAGSAGGSAALDRALADAFSGPAAAASERPASAPPPAAGYRYLPVPDGPDRHDDSDAREFPDPPDGYGLIGARVRGNKHKHEGTNCDDWFEFARAGGWTLIAVADGAGSRPLSRVGARTACRAAIGALTRGLRRRSPARRDGLPAWNAALARGIDGAFAAPDLEAIQQAVWAGFRRASSAVAEVASRTRGSGARTEPDHLACTLLLAAHTTAAYAGERLDFVITCHVGDGLIGALHRNGTPILLSDPDGGGYAGQTAFLTEPERIASAALASKTFVSLCRLAALFVMTDGVADDYHPPQDHLPRLWADLVVNGIPDLSAPADLRASRVLEETPYASPAELARIPGFHAPCEVVGPEPRRRVTLRSAGALAAGLGRSATDLLREPGLLWAARESPRAESPAGGPADRLREWLEAYQAPASFDDRTLVVFHREQLP